MPLMTLNRVVLPAPLGPIMPWISPGATASDTPSRTRIPPKRLVNPSTDRIGVLKARLGQRSRRAGRAGPPRLDRPALLSTLRLEPGRCLELGLGVLERPDHVRLAVHELHHRKEEALHEGPDLRLVLRQSQLVGLARKHILVPDALIGGLVDRLDQGVEVER